MKRILFFLATFFCGIAVSASTPQQDYVTRWAATAVEEMSRSGVPASITLAQGILESNSGQSELAVSSNNHFGIKCHSDWEGRSVLHKAEGGMECFRAYSRAEESFRDHSDFLRYQDRYKPLFNLDPTDYKSWARGLKQAGYATDPGYPDKLVKIVEDYKLYLYDVTSPGQIPVSPSALESPKLAEAVAGAKFKEEYAIQLSRPIYTINGSLCIYAIEGETLESIASNHGLFRGEILKYNDLSIDKALKTGDIVFLEFKKGQAAKGVDKYVVGEDGPFTLYDISQRFGVRLKGLKKLNPRFGDETLKEGDTVLLRKNK